MARDIDPKLKARWAKLAPGPLPEIEALRATRERVRLMTPEQLRQTFIDAGIYYPDGRLRPEYGG